MQIENLSKLFPELPETERKVAAEALDRYLEVAWEVLEEIEGNGPLVQKMRYLGNTSKIGDNDSEKVITQETNPSHP